MGGWTLLIVLVLATAYGLWHQAAQGRVKQVSQVGLSPLVKLLDGLGDQATLVQFSSAFCSPCRATRVLLADIADKGVGIKHIEIDAESELALVRELQILSTPTTLILDGSGREVGRAVGAPKRDQVLNALASLQ